AIYEDLAWLGLSWATPVLRQSARSEAYKGALRQLDSMGLVYPSFESRAEIARLVADRDRAGSWPRDPDGVPLYPGGGRSVAAAKRRQRIEAGDPFALRLDIGAAVALVKSRGIALNWAETGAGPDGETGTVAADPAAWGDVILARKDVAGSYHLSVAVDD